MGVRISLWLAVGLVFGTATAHVVVAEGTAEVFINELAWAGSSVSAQDEWIELFNAGSTPADISGWTLTKLTSGTEQPMLTLPAGSIIEPSGYFVVSNYPQAASVLNVEPSLVDSAITLSNTALKIGLYAGDFGTAELVDSAGDGGAPEFGNNELKLSMERNADLVGWHDAASRINLDDDVIDQATPLAANSTIQLPPEIVSVAPASAPTGNELELEEIIGNNFSLAPAPTVELIRDSVVLSADLVSVASSQLIDYARFNIAGAQPGDWDVRVVNPDGKAAVLPAAVRLTEAGDSYQDVRINEVYANPSTGEEEFIELYNFGNRTANLAGWTLDDIGSGGSAPYTIDALSISANSFAVLFKAKTKLTLNDASDEARLIHPTGTIVSQTNYVSAPDGESWAWFTNGWEWTDRVTQLAINIPHSVAGPIIDDDEDDSPPRVESPLTPVADKLELTELLPNPDDGEEFIEVFNPADHAVALAGWKLRDASGRSYTFPKQPLTIQDEILTSLPGKSYGVVWQSQSKLQLNNSGGETVELISPDNEVLSHTSYPDQAPIDGAYAASEASWLWSSQPTPGQVNVQATEEEVVLGESAEFTNDQLPPTGGSGRSWLGILLISFAASSIVWWRYRIAYDYQTNRYRQLVRHLQDW